ncbi:hypothetical protein FRB99_001150 [Tulasnella sp. 403]|nr:hypothetical protein FRB99_001150 [Tulasnella sp. 403]
MDFRTQLPYLPNELLERLMVIAYGVTPGLWTSNFIPRKGESTFRAYEAFASASRRFRRIALRAWFTTYIPRHVADLIECESTEGFLIDSDPLGLCSSVRHIYLGALFELKTLTTLRRFHNLKTLSYFADPHYEFLPAIPPSVQSLELRGSTHPRVELLTHIAQTLPNLVFLKIGNGCEWSGLSECATIEHLQDSYITALSPLTQLTYLSLNVNLGKLPRVISRQDRRVEHEIVLSLNLAKALHNLEGVEYQWETSVSSGAAEKSVFYVEARYPNHPTAGEDHERGHHQGRVQLRKEFMTKINEEAPWEPWVETTPMAWTVRHKTQYNVPSTSVDHAPTGIVVQEIEG